MQQKVLLFSGIFAIILLYTFTWKGAYKMAKIAVVEDNDAMREQLCGFIAQYARESGRQLDVTAFADGAEIVDPYRPGFDIIFLDIEMPTLGGMPTAERIRQVDPDVVLVFVTNMAQYAIRGYEVDALDFVLKPVSYYQFSTKLERALQRIQRLSGIRSVCGDRDPRPRSDGQGEHTQQAFGIDVVVAVYDADDAGKAVGSLDEPGRRLMVQAVRDLDRDFSRAQHKKTSSVSPCRGLSARCDGTE